MAIFLLRSSVVSGGGGGGDLVDGQTASISGSGFGSTGPEIIAWDTFESGTNGADIEDPEVGLSYVAPINTKYSTTSPHSGTKCLFSNPDAGEQFRNLNVNVISAFPDLYIHMWMRWTEDPNGGQLKQFQLWGDPFNETTFGPGFLWGDIGGWYATLMTEDNATHEGGFQGFEEFNATGQWNRIEIIGRQSSTGGATDGQVVIRVNGQSWYTKTNVKTRNDTANKWGVAHIVDGHTNPTGAYTDYFLDELLAQKGWARVLLGAQSTYAASDAANSLVPQKVTSWSGTAIEYTVFKANLSSGTVYEFVVDATNTVVKTTERTLQ